MSAAGLALVGAVTWQRLAELAVARSNTRRLLAQGAVEAGRGHYPLFVLLHALWLAACALVAATGPPPAWAAMAGLAALLGLRLWAMASLGRRWTTRVLALPGLPLVKRGPYRWCRHPNYLVVAGEIALLPLAFGAWRTALGFSLANAALLAWRVRVEERALGSQRSIPSFPRKRESRSRGKAGGAPPGSPLSRG